MKSEILNHDQVKHKIRRIAYQIAEVYHQENVVILAGIASGGYTFAKELKKELAKILESDIILCKVVIDKKNPRLPIQTSISTTDYTNKGIVLCDDVLNNGTTLIYSVRHFLDVPLKKFKTAVLVNRNHKKYPVKADFKGISLSTTLEEHVEVNLERGAFNVRLV